MGLKCKTFNGKRMWRTRQGKLSKSTQKRYRKAGIEYRHVKENGKNYTYVNVKKL